MDELVERLSKGRHPVEISLRPEKTLSLLKACLDRGYIHVKFTGTRGGTELGMPLDPQRTDLSQADLNQGTGSMTLVGELELNYVPVRCTATVDLPSMVGHGALEPVEPTEPAV